MLRWYAKHSSVCECKYVRQCPLLMLADIRRCVCLCVLLQESKEQQTSVCYRQPMSKMLELSVLCLPCVCALQEFFTAARVLGKRLRTPQKWVREGRDNTVEEGTHRGEFETRDGQSLIQKRKHGAQRERGKRTWQAGERERAIRKAH